MAAGYCCWPAAAAAAALKAWAGDEAMFKKFSTTDTKAQGDDAEALALAHLLRQGLRLVARNYRVAAGPGRRAGEVDLILHDGGGTLVFVEVRARRSGSHGGAAASVTRAKQRRIVYAARHYLLQFPSPPPCRFDVVTLEGEAGQQRLQWLRGAFDADQG